MVVRSESDQRFYTVYIAASFQKEKQNWMTDFDDIVDTSYIQSPSNPTNFLFLWSRFCNQHVLYNLYINGWPGCGCWFV